MNEKDEEKFSEMIKKIGMDSPESVDKAMGEFSMDKIKLVSDTRSFFNTWLGEAFYVIYSVKPTKEYIKETLTDYMEFVSEVFNETDDNIVSKLLDSIVLKSDEFTTEPFINLLYLKFSIIYGVVADITDIPFIAKAEAKEVKESLFINITRFVEVVDLFMDDWTPEMEKEDIKNVIAKMTDKLNRKYDTKGYELYS